MAVISFHKYFAHNMLQAVLQIWQAIDLDQEYIELRHLLHHFHANEIDLDNLLQMLVLLEIILDRPIVLRYCSFRAYISAQLYFTT